MLVRAVNAALQRVLGCAVILRVNTTHVLRQLLHILRVGTVTYPVAVDILALMILFNISHS